MVSIYNDKCWGYRKKSHQYHLSASWQGFCSVDVSLSAKVRIYVIVEKKTNIVFVSAEAKIKI
jgi:hypothetical protein